ncbi:MAG: hypothetical protein DRH49_04590, partial [Candidatus Coatesbacteria bacterium]
KRYIRDSFPSIFSPIYFLGGFDGLPVISYNDEWLIYSGYPPNESGRDIYRVKAENPEGEPEWLTFFDHTNCWGRISPDGEWLAFISDRMPHFPSSEIYIMHFKPEVPENTPNRVTYHLEGQYCWNLLWSPDAKWLFYTYSAYIIDDTIYKINPWEGMESQETITIADGEMVFPTDISPDGRWIAVNYYIYDYEEKKLQCYIGYISSEAGEQEIKEFFPPLEEGCNCWDASFSPDGEWIAFVSEMENVEGETDIFIYPFEPDE